MTKTRQPARTVPASAARTDLPTPLAQVLAELDRETQPFRAVHRLIDAVEVLIKLHTVLLVSRFAEVVESTMTPDHGLQVRKLLAGGLRTPSLGIWWAFARDAGAALQGAALAEPVPGLYAAVAKASPLFKALEGERNLLALRNSYAHGATPNDAACAADLAEMRPRLDALCDSSWPLADAEFLAVDASGQCLRLRGPEPVPMAEPPPGARAGRCYLRRADGTPLDLHPLLVWTTATGRGAGAFFYNDMRKSHASVLHYAWAHHERRADIRDDLLARYPIEQWGGEASADEAEIRERIAALTEDFKGRRAELQARVDALTRRDRACTLLWAPPGVGKSALMARTVAYLGWAAQTQADAYPEFKPPAIDGTALKLHVVRCFVRRGGFADVRELFETLNRQLDRQFNTGLGGATNAAEAAQRLAERLRKIGPGLAAHERLLVVIDGLDEAAEHPEFVRGLPKLAPPNVHLLYASRPQPVLRTEVYEQMEITQRDEVTLAGLSEADTRALLYDHADKYALDDAWVKAVATRSEGNPLYLQLLCNALELGEITLNRIDSVPLRMAELYDGVLGRVAATPHAEDLLALLAASHACLSLPALHHLLALKVPGLSAHTVKTAVHACAEVLMDDPGTPEEDWQLFHESLRDHLLSHRTQQVIEWRMALADWGLEWQDLPGRIDTMHPRDERLIETYALRWTAVHLEEMRSHFQSRHPAKAQEREQQLLALVENEAWRERSFLRCGNAEALRRAVQLAQQVAVARYRQALLRAEDEAQAKPGAQSKAPPAPGPAPDLAADALRVARFAQWTWGEEGRLYERQRQRLKDVHKGKDSDKQGAYSTRWREVADLAAMGARPRDRLMLAALALWGNEGTRYTQPRDGDLDMVRIRDWQREADHTAVARLWKDLGGPC